jgi:hypothetical protein
MGVKIAMSLVQFSLVTWPLAMMFAVLPLL